MQLAVLTLPKERRKKCFVFSLANYLKAGDLILIPVVALELCSS